METSYAAESDDLRTTLGLAMILHIIMCTCSLALIGFWQLTINTIIAILSFSSYLTLKPNTICLYAFTIVIGTTLAVSDLSTGAN